ncbi:MAG: hypothetical protein LAT82_05180 [Nanoarchaeota archaeon]|nr:hypothetical protein [Nanoarchaeota archaeon]
MRTSTLELDLQEFRDLKIAQLETDFENKSQELQKQFENKKSSIKNEFEIKFNLNKTKYSNLKINQAKKEANLVILQAKKEAKKKLEHTILNELDSRFVEIILSLLPSIEKILNTDLNNIVFSCSSKIISKFSSSKEFSKLVYQVVEDNTLDLYEVIFELNTDLKNELVRFNLKDEVKEIIERELN